MPISLLSQIDGANGFRFTAGASGDNAGFSVGAAGDINGDGFADVLVGAPNATGASPTGSAYLVFGRGSGFAASSSLTSLNGTDGFRLAGAAANDFAGFSVAGAGDIDGDGLADWLVGAHLADPGGIASAGSAYVVYGKFAAFPASVGLGGMAAGTGARLDGGATSDVAGYSVASAGDINGDGYADMLVGARAADPNGLAGAGASYLVFGSSTDLPATLGLNTMDASRGFLLAGVAIADNAGQSVGSAGDFNGDGFDDLLIGAIAATVGGSSAGAAYVVFGKAATFGTQLNLSTLNGTQGFALVGAAGDQAGVSVSSAGDINADGLDDLLVGARGGAGGNGAAYVVFGRREPMPASLSLAALDGTDGFRISGAALADVAGLSVAPVGDFNADGFDDFIIGANGNDGGGSQSGAAYILLGASGGFAANLSLVGLAGSSGVSLFGAAGERAGFSVSAAGDVNGDGFSDVAIGSVGGIGGGAMTVVFGYGMPGSGIHLQTSGDDTLTGAGDGQAVLYGGAGQDRLVIASSAFRSMDGGAGRDTLALSGAAQRLDLTAMPDNRIQGIEQIELTGTGRNTLILSPRDLLALSDTSNTLRVDGNADDLIGWTGSALAGATIQIASQFYRTYTQGAATLLVDTDIAMAPRDMALASLSAGQGLRLTGGAMQSYAGRSVSSAGDVNGDGFDDLVIGAYGRPGPGVSGNAKFGAAYVVFGAGGGLPQLIDLDSLDGSNGYRIRGSVLGEELGIAVSGVGDINGDGMDDLLIANNPTARPNSPGNFGGYIVYGQVGSYPVEVDAATLSMGSGAVRGQRVVDISGPYLAPTAVGGAGDFNGDGLDDLLVGVAGSGVNNTSTGRAYVLLGATNLAPDNLSVNDVGAPSSSRQGAVLTGAAAGDLAGVAVGSAGDVNGDGYDDVIVGAYRADAGGTDAGAAYVVFGGSTALLGQQLNLGSLSPSQGFRLVGANSNDFSGKAVSRAGDVNGDGFGDLLVGGYNADINGVNSGAAYLVFGKASGFGSVASLGALDGSNGLRLSGAAAGDYAGVSVGAAGDVNGDGFDDILVGAYLSDANGNNSGATYLVYGKAGGFAAEIALGALNGVDGMRITGATAEGRSGRSVQGAGDINGDGFDDLVIGSYLADVGALLQAGTAHVLFGGDFTGSVTHAGGAAADALTGGIGNDAMIGGLGNDTLAGAQGRDVLRGGAGNDILRGGSEADLLDGGGGTDTADYSAAISGVSLDLAIGKGLGGDALGDVLEGIENLLGSPGNDVLSGDRYANLLDGLSGDDSINGMLGNDSISGGDGFDSLLGGVGNDTLRGGINADTLLGGDGNDLLNGGKGTDSLDGGAGNDTLIGALGTDLLNGGSDIDTADYSGSTDGVSVSLLITTAQQVSLATGLDTLLQIENLVGSAFPDTLTGSTGNNTLVGGLGNDTLNGDGGFDSLDGGDGNDSLSGGLNADTLMGGIGNDFVGGGQGTDSLVGGDGDDTLVGGLGTDRLVGGAGADHYVFRHALDGVANIDTFADLETGVDVVELSASIFTALAGSLGLKVGTGANLIYNNVSGVLAYDADGAGPGAAITFGIVGVSTHPASLGNDFLIVA